MDLGWALPKRIEYFRDAEGAAKETYRIRFQGDFMTRPLFIVPIGLPKYRLENGRTVSLQAEWLAKNPRERSDFFRSDPENDRAQTVQHELLSLLGRGKGLKEYFTNRTNKQVDPVILDSNGFVVNGNRRLCCWRDLYESDKATYGHFSHVRVIVLPPSDDKAIDRLEAELQVAQDIRDEYTWDTLANMLYERQEQHGYSEAELAELYDKRPAEIRELLEMRDYAIQYMQTRGKPNHWGLVRTQGTEYAFRKILKTRRQAATPTDKRIIENVSFAMLDDPDGFGRLYDAIPKLGEQLPKLKERLEQELEPVGAPVTGTDGTKFFETSGSGSADEGFLRSLEEEGNRTVIREVAKDIIEEARIQESEERNASYVRKRLQRAHSEVQSAVSGLNESSSRTGVGEQISAIEVALTKIKRWLSEES